MIEALQDMYSQQSFVEKIERNLSLDWPTRYRSKPAGVALYAAHLGTYLHALTEKYNTLCRELICNLDRLLKATNGLRKRRIPIEIIPPDMLEMFAEDVMKQLRLTHPDYTLALPHISYYYNMELVTFAIDEGSALIVTFPMLIKPIHLQSLTLSGIETVHVPIDDLNTKVDSFSKVSINKEYLAGNECHYIQLRKEELKMCKCTQNKHYYKELFVVKHSNMHTCESALFYDVNSNIIEDKCDFDFYYNLTIRPCVLDGGNEIVLVNMFG